MTHGLEEAEIKGLQKIFSSCGAVEKAVLFGSRARGNHRKYSDIDLALFGDSLDLERKWALEEEIEKLALPYKTDLALEQQIKSPIIRDHIQREGVPIYVRGFHAP